jgi:hypothetical protein
MKRQLFAICDGRAVLSIDGTNLSHVDYMVEQGILSGPNDAAYERAVRGYVQHGELRVFQGASFTLPERTPELLSRLRQVSHKLKLDKRGHARITVYNPAHRLSYVSWQLWTADEIVAGEPLLAPLHNGKSVL